MALSEDLAKIVRIGDDDFRSLLTILSNPENKKIDWAIQTEKLSREGNEDDLKALLRVLDFVASNCVAARNYHTAFSDLTDLVQKLVSNDSDAKGGWDKIVQALPALQAFFLLKKESDLKDRFNRVTDVSITLDARPLFSMDKSSIVKTIYPFIVKIEGTDADDFTCEFYEDTLDELIEELNLAKRKLQILKEYKNG